jgi:betaine-aldehyde dehydrogenase
MRSLYIAGKWVPASDGATAQTINPSDTTVLDTLAEATADDVAAAVTAAREAFDDGPWRRSTVTERTALLTAIADLLQRDREQLARTESLDTGKTLNEARFDVDDSTAVFRYYAGMAASQAGRVVDAGRLNVVSRIVHEPVGVCALITPWNYPLLQISWKLAPALAAGNTAVIKPSEVTPLSTVSLMALIEEAGPPPGVVNLLLGTGAVAGAALVAHPGVDLISFTGGLATGERIMAAAARGVRRVALELGGKNPNIVFADTDFDTVVDNALTAAFLHSGQVCSAGARLIVQDVLYDSFVASLAERANLIRLGDGLAPGTECGPLVSAAHREKVERYIAVSLAEGAELLAGGERPAAPELAAGYFLRPTVLGGCTRSMTAVREEVFGPVVTVERFSTEAEAVFLGNDTAYGLAGAVWTNDAGRAERVAGALRHGTVWINDYHPYLPQAEWGGFGKSGIGRELGPSGLAEYTEVKHIYHNTTPAPARWFSASLFRLFIQNGRWFPSPGRVVGI